jgi:DNA polymerase III delta prime subunit
MKTTIWVERYRPKSISDVIFQDDRQRKQFEAFIEAGDIPHLFLTGVQGTGKTTVSRALIHDLKIDPSDVLKINCSDEKIDAMRSKVTSFAMSMPIGKFKVVRLEEIDYLSLDGQALLRSLIEEASGSCRFIATCNYANKVIPPLKSRFQEFYFKAPDKEKVALRVAEILDIEGIDYEPEDLLTYVDVGYPDIRKIIQLLQGNVNGKKLLSPSQVSADSADWKFGLLDAITKGDFKKARKLVCESATREEHEDVYRFLYANVDKMKVADKEAAIITIAEYLYKHSIVADTEINIAALMIELSRL